MMPPMKHAVPRSLFLRAKKATVCRETVSLNLRMECLPHFARSYN